MSARKGSSGDVQLQREAKTEEAGPADRSQEMTGTQAEPDMGGWETAGAKTKRPTNATSKGKGTGNPGHESSAEPKRERKLSPTKYAGTKRGKDPPKGLNGGAGSRADKGDGSVVFQQLRSYLQNQASQAYVTHTVLRLNDLARERRFKSYLRTMPAEERSTQTEDEIKESWKDEAPQWRQDKFEGLRSKWNVQSTEHQDRLYNLMRKWVLEKNEKQREIEDRLQFFQFEGRVAAEDPPQNNDTRTGGSYLEAVRPQSHSSRVIRMTAEQTRLTELCLRPAEPTNQLRQRTDDEVKAIVMILNHELEVPHVPPFLAQTMGPGELAVFEDLFLALEYPLYAHLAPGQRFFANMTKGAILAQIYGGAEAAPAQKQEIEDFKRLLSRITIDMETRVVKVTFKGKQSAARWSGWQMPLATKLLPLIDYEQEREHAAATNKLVMLDFYSFDVEVRKGAMTSRDMFWLLSKILGLKVQAMTHPVSEETGIKEQQWTVRIHASACPAELRQLGSMQIDDVEVVIHHSAIHVNWPCKRCHAPDHPTRFCKILLDDLEGEKKKHTNKYQGTKPSTKGASSREYAAGSQPRTMEQLEAMLRTEGSKLDGRAAGRTSWSVAEKRPTSPTRRTTDSTKEKLKLPEEWGQSLQPSKAEEPADDYLFEVFDDGLECKRQQEVPPVDESTLKTEGHDLKENNSLEVSNNREPEQFPQDDQEMIIQDDGGSDGDVEMVTAAEQSRIAVEHATATKLTKQKQIQERVKQKTDVRGRSPTKRQGRTLQERKKAQEKARKKSKDTQDRMEKKGCQPGAVKASNNAAKEGEDGFAGKTRKASLSPKRKAADLGTGHDGDDEDEQGDPGHQGALLSTRGRSFSPKRRSTNAAGSGDKFITQSFIHQYMKATTIKSADNGEVRAGSGVDRESRAPTPTKSAPINYHSNPEHEHKSGPVKEHTEADCSIVAVTEATDTGAPLSTWMAILGGTVVDVAANGNCGWLAFYASLYNEAEGVQIPTPEVTDKVNQLKKMVLNEMIANLSEEMKLHPEELEVELRASGCHAAAKGDQVQQLCALANHLATQRDKTVKAQVPLHFWVRPCHLKAMAMHARETIYVLDVQSNDQARIQAYAYHEVESGTGDTMETGTVCPIPTQQAMDLLADLIAADIRPPVMVLRWRSSGNHFQAVQYQPDAHAKYAKDIIKLSRTRNDILKVHGWKVLDIVSYDEVMTAKAAAKSLATIRKAARVRQEEANKQRLQDGEEVRRVTVKSKPRSADGQLQEEGVEGDADPWDPEQTTREGNATGSSKPEVDRKSSMTGTLEVENTSVVMVKGDAALSNRGSEELSLYGKSDEASKSAVVDTSDLDSMVAGVAQTQ